MPPMRTCTTCWNGYGCSASPSRCPTASTRRWASTARACREGSGAGAGPGASPTSVVVFDEPAEHLDIEAADDLTRDLLITTAGRSTLLITHRLATLHLVDEILVLDWGRVVQRGSHTTLMTEDGRTGAGGNRWSVPRMGCAPRGSHPSGSRPDAGETRCPPCRPNLAGSSVARAHGVAGATAAVGYRLLVQGGLTGSTPAGGGRYARAGPHRPRHRRAAGPRSPTCSQSPISGGRRGPWPASSMWSSAGGPGPRRPLHADPARVGRDDPGDGALPASTPHRLPPAGPGLRPVRGRAFPADPGSGRHSLSTAASLARTSGSLAAGGAIMGHEVEQVVRATFDTVKAEAERRVTRR